MQPVCKCRYYSCNPHWNHCSELFHVICLKSLYSSSQPHSQLTSVADQNTNCDSVDSCHPFPRHIFYFSIFPRQRFMKINSQDLLCIVTVNMTWLQTSYVIVNTVKRVILWPYPCYFPHTISKWFHFHGIIFGIRTFRTCTLAFLVISYQTVGNFLPLHWSFRTLALVTQ